MFDFNKTQKDLLAEIKAKNHQAELDMIKRNFSKEQADLVRSEEAIKAYEMFIKDIYPKLINDLVGKEYYKILEGKSAFTFEDIPKFSLFGKYKIRIVCHEKDDTFTNFFQGLLPMVSMDGTTIEFTVTDYRTIDILITILENFAARSSSAPTDDPEDEVEIIYSNNNLTIKGTNADLQKIYFAEMQGIPYMYDNIAKLQRDYPPATAKGK